MNSNINNSRLYQDELAELCKLELPYDMMKNCKILITGANGMICSYLVEVFMKMNELYQLNIKVIAMVRDKEKGSIRFEKYLKNLNFILLIGDVTDSNIFNNHEWDYIIHGAGNSHPQAFSNEPVETMKSNLLGTMNILDHIANDNDRKLKKFLFLSSGEVYGHSPLGSERGWDEKTIGMVDTLSVRSCYPESKRASETLCQAYHKEYGIKTVIVRLCYVYGLTLTDSNTRADAQFLRNAMNGNDIVLKSEGKQFRSYCYLYDAAAGIIYTLLNGKPGECYNLSSQESKATIREYAEIMAKIFETNIRFELPDEKESTGYSKMLYEILDSSKLESLGWKADYGINAGICRMKEILYEVIDG